MMLQTPLESCSSKRTLIALGSNAASAWGDVATTVQKASAAIARLSDTPPVISRLFKTPAFPAGAGPDFVNAVIRIETRLSALDVLAALHEIEADAGRERTVRWGQRTLDLDLIAMADEVLPDATTHRYWRDLPLDQQVKVAPDELILPHPRLQDRSFVLVPLTDVAPDWVHPILDQTVLEMRDARPEAELASVIPI